MWTCLLPSAATDRQRGARRTGSTGGRWSRPLVWKLSCGRSCTGSSGYGVVITHWSVLSYCFGPYCCQCYSCNGQFRLSVVLIFLFGGWVCAIVFQKRDFPVETYDGNKTELFRRCLCSGYFTNVARRYRLFDNKPHGLYKASWNISQQWDYFNFFLRSFGKVFCTMDGHGSMVHIHPSSSVNTFFIYRYFYI